MRERAREVSVKEGDGEEEEEKKKGRDGGAEVGAIRRRASPVSEESEHHNLSVTETESLCIVNSVEEVSES